MTDTLRGIACLALVAYHVVGATPQSGLELPADHWMPRANAALLDLRMPLFAFLSGLVLPCLTGGRAPWRRIGRKAHRLLVPLAVVGTAFWLLRDAMGQGQPPLQTILVLPFAHFWFLQASFAMTALALVLVWLSHGRDMAVMAGIGLGGAALYLSGARLDTNIMSLNFALRLMPFFAAGYLIARRPDLLLGRANAARAGIAAALIAGAVLASTGEELSQQARRLAGLGVGLTFCLSLVALAPRHAGLARVGRSSYAVYLLHVFFTAGTVKLFWAASPDAPAVLIAGIGLTAGIAGPMLAERAILRVPPLSVLCLGLTPDRAARAVPTPAGAMMRGRSA